MNYKIKIPCTHKQDLSYNKKKIKKTNYHELKKVVHNIEYIEKTLILYKNKKNLTTKTLEFLCKREIDEYEFKNFIKNMQNNGYSSEKNTSIQFIKLNNNNEIIFEYYFQSITKKENTIPTQHKPNNSYYRTHILYSK